MTRRRLSQQQQRRIRASRERQVALTDAAQGDAQQGLVIARYGKRALIEGDNGERQQCVMRGSADGLVAGDRVIWRPAAEEGVIDARAERHSVLTRPDSRGNLRPVAANIDLMLIVLAPKPQAHANLIDRYLVAAAMEGIAAALVLNKADLQTANDGTAALADTYAALGYPVQRTSRETDPQAVALEPLINDRTLVLVGQSGVGKSSLINRLLPDLDIRVGALSDAIDKGRHTTTAAELYHLPGGGRLIDSPGIREFHLHHLEPQDIAMGFIEFREYLGHCRFRDCSHDHETGCALLAAVEAGQISSARFESYRQIVASPLP